MTSPTAAPDPHPAASRQNPGQGPGSHRPGQQPPHHHLKTQPAKGMGGLIAIGLVCGYEVGATALNRALDEDVLPTLRSLVENASPKEWSLRGARVVGQVGMWATLAGMVVIVEIGRRQRQKLRASL